jgi:hypothetical protein
LLKDSYHYTGQAVDAVPAANHYGDGIDYWSATVHLPNTSRAMRPVLTRISGSAFIAVGMTLLGLAMCWPNLPVITAVALVALGATEVTLARYGGTRMAAAVLLLHAATYGGLYALFIGATLAAAATSPAGGISVSTVLDLSFSTIPAAAALRRICACIASQLLSER